MIKSADLLQEIVFTTSRSSGPGGQNVNKVNSRVTLKIDVLGSQILSPEQKDQIQQKLSSWITKEGVLMLTVQEARSQLQNKEVAISKLDELLTKAFTPIKKRKKSKPGKAAKRKRLESKRQHAEKKQWRQKL